MKKAKPLRNRKLTLIKIGSDDYQPSNDDLVRWQKMFSKHAAMNARAINMMSDGQLHAEEFVTSEENDFVTIVRIGPYPSLTELNQWKDAFEAARGDPDAVIFTHSQVKIDRIVIGRKIKIE